MVDTLGLLQCLVIQPANLQDRIGAKAVFTKAKQKLTRLQKVWADGNYTGVLIDWVKKQCHWDLEIVYKPEGIKTFDVLPKRWLVERTFSWLNPYRLLAKEYELTIQSSESNIYIALSHLMLKRIAD